MRRRRIHEYNCNSHTIIISRISGEYYSIWWVSKMIPSQFHNRRYNCMINSFDDIDSRILLFLILSRSYSSSPGFVGLLSWALIFQEAGLHGNLVAVQPCTRKLDRWGSWRKTCCRSRGTQVICALIHHLTEVIEGRTFQRSYRKNLRLFMFSSRNECIIHIRPERGRNAFWVLKRQRNKVWIWRPFMKRTYILILNPLGCIVTGRPWWKVFWDRCRTHHFLFVFHLLGEPCETGYTNRFLNESFVDKASGDEIPKNLLAISVADMTRPVGMAMAR
jgi:hypothetical protein